MRELNDNIVTAANASAGAYPIDFVKVVVDPDDSAAQLLMTTGYRSVTFGGDTYIPAGHLLSISAVDNIRDVKTNPITLSLSGVDDAVVAALNSNPVFGSSVEIYRTLWDDTTNDIVSTPYLRWSGIIVSHSTDIQGNGDYNISVTCKNLLEALLDTKSGRFTSLESFSQYDPADKSMEFVAGMTSWQPVFGKEG